MERHISRPICPLAICHVISLITHHQVERHTRLEEAVAIGGMLASMVDVVVDAALAPVLAPRSCEPSITERCSQGVGGEGEEAVKGGGLLGEERREGAGGGERRGESVRRGEGGAGARRGEEL